MLFSVVLTRCSNSFHQHCIHTDPNYARTANFFKTSVLNSLSHIAPKFCGQGGSPASCLHCVLVSTRFLSQSNETFTLQKYFVHKSQCCNLSDCICQAWGVIPLNTSRGNSVLCLWEPAKYSNNFTTHRQMFQLLKKKNSLLYSYKHMSADKESKHFT